MTEKKYIELKDLEIYQISRELSRLGWEVYKAFSFEHKKTMGDQFIRSMDSVGANIAKVIVDFIFLIKFVFTTIVVHHFLKLLNIGWN